MSGNPWWFSGDQGDPDSVTPEPESTGGQGLPSFDLGALAGTAQRLIDWAGERIMAPHADHTNPHEHPQCMICRTMLLLGEGGSAPDRSATARAEPAADIVWIPIVEESDEP